MLADSKEKIKQVLDREKNFYDDKLMKTYEAQRKDRMGDAIGDYLTDEKVEKVNSMPVYAMKKC